MRVLFSIFSGLWPIIFVYGASAEIINNLAVVRGTNSNAGSNLVSILATVQPATNYLVESSFDLQNWGPASTVLTSTTNTLAWNTKECAGLGKKFYRMIKRPASFVTNSPTGRLTQGTNGFTLVTHGGWRIEIKHTFVRMTHPNTNFTFDFWGSTHESLGGQHVKDIHDNHRTYRLTDDTLMTITRDPSLPLAGSIPGAMGQIASISIYDENQSHRVNTQTFSVDYSSAISQYGEANEYDGESGRFVDNADGLFLENIYQQGNPCAGSSEKVFNTVPIAQLYTNDPNRVVDYWPGL